ncbi:MAG: c-type cytochrome biogenesis protein CcmI [Reyranella sp.]|uniref:c-type cytochrome biogenesis protein CcmI n=1 Tax=Reyranella sp. TaxID=1929291 RepID=UPI001ACBC147|nr:c-type cytochrome biogenesis protein CcmI [Reyranella sp.]MBN9087369.1 c-type cytochrome biogenesis protein CcmI [Reyranella sp.]
MLEFLLALLTTATVAALLAPLLRRQIVRRDRLASDTAVYRDQLAEVERERGRGALSVAEADAARTEIERRLLAAADRDKAEPEADASWHRFLVPAMCLLIPLFALGLYLRIGQPGLPAAPFVARSVPAATPDQSRDVAQAVAALRARLAEKPDDVEALSALGEALTHQADGVVTAEAQGLLRRALEKNPDDARAMFYLGLADAQGGDSRAALKRWGELEQRSPPNAPWLATLREEMQRVARAAGLPAPAAPTPPPGPTQDQMQAMQNLSPADRQQAIRGMVEGLEARLRASSGKPEDRDGWLRLANARRVLGENDKAVEAYAKADALGTLEPRLLADWAEVHVRQLQPGTAPSAAAVAVLERLEKAEPRNALALFYLGAADFARGDKPSAVRRWKTLLALLPADAPIRAMLEGKIKEAE